MSCHHSGDDVICCSVACACCKSVSSWELVEFACLLDWYVLGVADVDDHEKEPCDGLAPLPGNSSESPGVS